jgi:hypothetical protein
VGLHLEHSKSTASAGCTPCEVGRGFPCRRCVRSIGAALQGTSANTIASDSPCLNTHSGRMSHLHVPRACPARKLPIGIKSALHETSLQVNFRSARTCASHGDYVRMLTPFTTSAAWRSTAPRCRHSRRERHCLQGCLQPRPCITGLVVIQVKEDRLH